MTQYEMTEELSEKMNMTLEEAKAALEAGNWNMLTATHMLEQEKFRRMRELDEVVSGCEATAVQAAPAGTATDAQKAADEAAADVQAAVAENVERAEHTEKRKRTRGKGLKNLGNHIRRLVACGNHNRFVVHRGDATVLELPVTVLVLLLLCAFWACLIGLGIGLFSGCRYSFNGRELGRAGINGALTKAADAADHMKKTIAET